MSETLTFKWTSGISDGGYGCEECYNELLSAASDQYGFWYGKGDKYYSRAEDGTETEIPEPDMDTHIPAGDPVWFCETEPYQSFGGSFSYCEMHAHSCPTCHEGLMISEEVGSSSTPPASWSNAKFSCGHEDNYVTDEGLES